MPSTLQTGHSSQLSLSKRTTEPKHYTGRDIGYMSNVILELGTPTSNQTTEFEIRAKPLPGILAYKPTHAGGSSTAREMRVIDMYLCSRG